MRSGFLKLNARDFAKGLLLAVITAVITGLYELLQSGTFAFDWLTLKPIVIAAVSAALAYLLKNLFTNTEGQILTKDSV